jgi:hypothetical protein
MITCPTCRREFKSPKSIGSHSKKCHVPVDALFWMKVDKSAGPDACWPYSRLDKLGYGRFDRKGPLVFAHRCAWIFTHGEIPEGMDVLHRCDNRKCCNPSHLFLGTHQENMLDMHRKGRQTRCSFTHDEVREIKAELSNYRHGLLAELARKYDVTVSQIWAIRAGRNYAWLK